MRPTLFVTALLLFCADSSFAQNVGDKVEVVSANVTLKVESKNGIVLPKGTALTVKQVNGEWLWIEYGNDKGWIKKSDVTAPKSSSDVAKARRVTAKKLHYVEIVSVDRRPAKDAVYSKCVGTLRDEADDSHLFAVDVIGDRLCPLPEEITFKEYHEYGPCVYESGKTVIEYVKMDKEVFWRTSQYKNKTWRFMVLPAKVTVTTPSFSDPKKQVMDTFYIARLKTGDIGSSNPKWSCMTIACDDASTLEQAFKTMLPTKEPLGYGKPDTLQKR